MSKYKDLETLKRKDPKLYEILVNSGQLNEASGSQNPEASAPGAASAPDSGTGKGGLGSLFTPEQAAELDEMLAEYGHAPRFVAMQNGDQKAAAADSRPRKTSAASTSS